MGETDPRTARILAGRMVGSFFDGLSKQELAEIVTGQADNRNSSGLSMLAYTMDVFYQSVELSEDVAMEMFGEAVKEKLNKLRNQIE